MYFLEKIAKNTKNIIFHIFFSYLEHKNENDIFSKIFQWMISILRILID